MKKYLLALFCFMASTQAVQGFAGEGMYVGGIGGMNQLKYDPDVLDVDLGYALGGFGGYKFQNGLRIEGELSFRRNRLKDSFTLSNGIDEIKMDIKMQTKLTTVMANALYEFCPRSVSTIYLGFGIGYARIIEDGLIEGGGIQSIFLGKTDQFAWQAIVGLNRRIATDRDFGVEYRYLNSGVYIENHSVVLALKRFF